MGFLDTVERAKAALRRNRRVSLRGLKREFGLDQGALDELVEELVEVQRVASREGALLCWTGGSPGETDTRPASPLESAITGAERRQLTVMFCDLVGSTQLAERLDPEDLRDVIRSYHRAVSQPIARYEGTIAQYLGDGVLVFFGYPQAHEDDAERAARAALEMLAALDALNDTFAAERDIRLSVRIGIHTGPVVVAALGGGEKRDLQALGSATIIAARLQRIADAGTIVISGATLRLVSGLFRTRDLGTPELEGITEQVQAYELLEPGPERSRLDVDPSRLTPFVGRDQELALLLDRWERVKAGEGKAVLVSGEAGFGKSRLARVFRERIAAEPHGWLECRCSPYKSQRAFHPLIEPIQEVVAAADSLEEKLRRLEDTVRHVGLPGREAVPLLASVLSLKLPAGHPQPAYSPELQHRKTVEALGAWVLCRAQGRPLVLLVEDLHWSDPSTVELLTLLIEQSPGAPVMVLVTFRPEFAPPWPALSHLTHLEVGRLEAPEAESLVARMTGDPLPAEVVGGIVGRADGVPLFLEELTKMVRESRAPGAGPDRKGSAARDIPATLQDSLTARLDRLGNAKQLAQLGAVLGREFSDELLRAVAAPRDVEIADGLEALLDAELLVANGAAPHATYSFKHTLIQEAAYQSLLRSARRRVHAATAKALEERFTERAEAEPEVVAWHYDEAGLAEPAVAHYRRAARRAKRQSASAEAIASLKRALELVATLSPGPERDRQELDLQLAVGEPLYTTRGWADPVYGAHLERARELAMKVGSSHELFFVWVGLYLHHQVGGDLRSAESSARAALEMAESMDDQRLAVFARSGLSQALYMQGAFAPALEPLEKAIAPSGPRAQPAAEEDAGRHLQTPFAVGALCRWTLGYPDQALEICDAALAQAREAGTPFEQAMAHIYSGWILQKRGARTPALSAAQKAIDLCERLDLFWLPWATALRGAVSGQGDLAVGDIQRGIADLESAGARGWVPHCYGALAEVNWKLQRPAEALRAVEQGLECARQTGQRYEDSELLRLRGEIQLRLGDATREAERDFASALDVALQQQAKSLELRAATSLARLWTARGRASAARQVLAPVHDWFTEGFETQDWKEAQDLLTKLG